MRWKKWSGLARAGAAARPDALKDLVEPDRPLARARLFWLREPHQDVIKPQYAVERLYELTKDRDTYITTEVGQHQMWAAQHYHFETRIAG